MAVRLLQSDKDGIFYITFTCLNWHPLFELTDGYDIVYKWFDYLKTKGHFITGYVIMPNHIHILVGVKNSEKSINTIISNAKRFMAYEIVNRLREKRNTGVLGKLAKAVTASDVKRGKLHQVFEPSFDSKQCYTEAFTEQNLDYIHNNPCTGKWNLATSPELYTHSSAKYYFSGEHHIYPVNNFKELMDVNLTK